VTESTVKIRQSLFLLLIFFSSVYAEEQVNIKLTTSAVCSPAIGINNGKVVINCTDPELEAKVRSLPDLSGYNANMSQLAELGKESSIFEEKLYQLENDSQTSTADINQLRDQHRLAEVQYTELYQQHVQLSSQLASVLARLPEIVEEEISTTIPEISASLVESIYDQQFQKHTKSFFFKVDNRLNSQSNRLDNLETRVYALESDVSFLMNEYLNGRLQNHVGFFGLSVGGLYISEEWQSRIGIEYELLLPKSKILGSLGTVYIELAKLDWTETQEYLTLSGIEPISVVDKHKLNLLNVGSRLFFHGWSDDLQSYLVASFGHSIASNEDTFSYSIGIGTEYFRSSTRVSFEVRWEGFSNISHEEITFNPLGDASIATISESRDGWYAGIKIAFQ